MTKANNPPQELPIRTHKDGESQAKTRRMIARDFGADPRCSGLRVNQTVASSCSSWICARPNVCGARTRSGKPCQSPAMANGRCRMHGGPSPGAPKRSQHAYKHGRYSAEAIARRREISPAPAADRVNSGNHCSRQPSTDFCNKICQQRKSRLIRSPHRRASSETARYFGQRWRRWVLLLFDFAASLGPSAVLLD
jgi:hypothetical protein